MSFHTIEQEFQSKVSSMIQLVAEGVDRYRVLTPFRFEDGDHLCVVIKKQDVGWLLTDEAHTFMHLSYDTNMRDLNRGTRRKLITNILSVFQIEEHEGELILPVPNEQFGDALYSYIQALLKVTDLSFLRREQVRSTFMEDFSLLIVESVPDNRAEFKWHDSERDPMGMYTVDCRINGHQVPIMIHALPNNRKTRDATISLLQFEKWRIPFRSLAIFESQEDIDRKVLARFSDVCEKQFSSIVGSNSERIALFLKHAIAG